MTEHARLSARIAAIAESATLKVDAKAKALQAAGRPVIRTPPASPTSRRRSSSSMPPPRRCTTRANYRYTPAAGLPVLREAIAAKTLRDSGLEVDASQVVVTNGGKQAVYQAFQAVVNPGDEVLLPAPYWTTYPEAIALADGVPVEVFAGADQDYKVTVEQLEAARTDTTTVLRVRVAVEPDRLGVHPRARRRRSASGPSSTASGSSRTRSTRTSSTTRRARRVDRRGGAGCRCPDDPRQRRREDLRDDRLAPGLDGRPEGRDQGRRQPAVAPRSNVKTSRSAPRWPRSPARRTRPRRFRLAFDRRRRSSSPSCRRSRASRCRTRWARSTCTPTCGTARPRVARQDPDDVARARRPHARGGRGRRRARRGVRPQRLPAPVATRSATTPLLEGVQRLQRLFG